MKNYSINLSAGKDIKVEVPDGIELTVKQVAAIAGMLAQEQIAAGNVSVTERVWPCLYCGRKFLEQMKLVAHLETHQERIEQLEKLTTPVETLPSDKPTPSAGTNDVK